MSIEQATMLLESFGMTHDELALLGAKYLEKSHLACKKRMQAHCIVTTGISAGETPDVLGFWGGGQTTLIEVKMSRSDFLADRKKWFRREPERGMGNRRYYLAPKGLLSPDELPDKWGLMEESNGKIKVIKLAEHRLDVCKYSEICVLQSLIRRIGRNAPKGASVKFYTYETKNTCTAGVRTDDILPDTTGGAR